MNTIWITGGSSGIGFAVAQKFIQENWRVIISSSNEKKLESAKREIISRYENCELHSYKCDISNRSEVEKTIHKIEKDLDKIDIALLNAAAYSPNKNQDFEIANYEKLIDVNLKGTLYCIEMLKKQMESRKKGHIAIVSSPVGYRGLPTAGAYGLTKAGLINLAESLYFDFGRYGVRVCLVSPGFIKTPMTDKNDFKMPFLKTPEFSADKIYNGLINSSKFEIHFPKELTLTLKFFKLLPSKIYFYLVKKLTKFQKKN